MSEKRATKLKLPDDFLGTVKAFLDSPVSKKKTKARKPPEILKSRWEMIYVKGAGVALGAAVIAGIISEIGMWTFGLVRAGIMVPSDGSGIGAFSYVDITPFVIVAVFALALPLAVRRFRRTARRA